MGGRRSGGWRLGPVPPHGRSLTTFAGQLMRSLVVFGCSLTVLEPRLMLAPDELRADGTGNPVGTGRLPSGR